jgi:hypothetical protein
VLSRSFDTPQFDIRYFETTIVLEQVHNFEKSDRLTWGRFRQV